MNMKVWNEMTNVEKEELWTKVMYEYNQRRYNNLNELQSA